MTIPTPGCRPSSTTHTSATSPSPWAPSPISPGSTSRHSISPSTPRGWPGCGIPRPPDSPNTQSGNTSPKKPTDFATAVPCRRDKSNAPILKDLGRGHVDEPVAVQHVEDRLPEAMWSPCWSFGESLHPRRRVTNCQRAVASDEVGREGGCGVEGDQVREPVARGVRLTPRSATSVLLLVVGVAVEPLAGRHPELAGVDVVLFQPCSDLAVALVTVGQNVVGRDESDGVVNLEGTKRRAVGHPPHLVHVLGVGVAVGGQLTGGLE